MYDSAEKLQERKEQLEAWSRQQEEALEARKQKLDVMHIQLEEKQEKL